MNTINDILKELYSKFYINLVSYCRALGLTATEAEDCVEEVFIRFWLNSSTLKDIGTSKQQLWLYKACCNVIHEMWRERENVDGSDISELEDIPSDSPSKIEEVIELDTYYRLIEVIRSELISTDIEYKIINIMINGELDLGYKELSDKYGINSSTLRSQVRRLRLKIEENLPEILHELYDN